MKLLDGKKLSEKILKHVKLRVNALKKKRIYPCLAIVQVGNHPSSTLYVSKKLEAAEFTGIKTKKIHFPESISKKKFLSAIDKLNKDKSVHGILIQLPLPKKLNSQIHNLMEIVLPKKDVDGFHPFNQGKNLLNENSLVACTPKGVMRLLNEYKIDLQGKKCVMVGSSNIVGKPLAMLLLNSNATVTICNIYTKNLKEFTSKADLIAVATGVPHLIKSNMVKKGVIIVDIGTTKIKGKLLGDVDFNNVKKKASFITPVPGGVGPMTVASLMENTVLAAEMQSKRK
ncbi:MAG: bifunctional 5,10-methylenetetrahydrofolate dehydrogenase/5,10-methenyltetrahydrofolate cyclohydrolase [Candidatus Diapherotrites archaeon]